jgi:hypothetical protein
MFVLTSLRSASGNIITEALAAHFPTIIVYVMDTVRSTNPVTFMSVSWCFMIIQGNKEFSLM